VLTSVKAPAIICAPRHAEEFVMKWCVGLSCVAGMLLSLSALATAQGKSLDSADQTDTAAGKRIFDAQCAWCHGTDGVGGTGSTLQGRKLRHAADDAALIGILKNGIPGTEMPAFAFSLTDGMAWQTAAYVRSLGRLPPLRVPGNPERGAAIYESRGCATCHIVSGRGGGLGPELTAIGALRGPGSLRESVITPEAAQSPGYLVVRAVTRTGKEVRGNRVNEDVFWVHIRDAAGTLQTLEKSELTLLERDLKGTLMPSYASALSITERDDLVAYLSSLRGGR
jgi:cytochrome c oxidase cbb3-type subunit III